MTPWLNSPDFVYIYNGVCFDYKGIVDAMKPMLSTQINQKVTIKDEKYAILDKSTVIYTSNCTFLENYKDGHAVLEDPAVIQITFRKINDKWMAVSGLESSVRQNAKNSETSKELNQVELSKQWIGTWKCDISKDTIGLWVETSYGTGLEGNFKYVSKGKTVMEGKEFYGYDNKSDKCIAAQMIKGKDIEIFAFWFISKNKWVQIPYSNISNLESASFRVEGELKSPDVETETTFVNNKPVKSETWTRVK
jgi:hypothetical protein